jgi:hypothetical protein
MKARVLIATALALSTGAMARAEGNWRTDKDVARDIARRGAEYFDEGDWERAREHFHRAYDIVQAPTLALMEARALVQLGRLAEATDVYAKASVAHDDGNEPYRRAASEAREELAALSPRVPSIRVVFADDEPRPVVKIDGYPLVGSTSVAVNPGTHVITIARPGVPESWQSVTLGEGDQRAITIERVLSDQAGTGANASRSLSPLMWTAFGVGGAGLATGIVTGALALGKKATLDRACDGPACPPGSEDDMRDYRRWRTASIVGYLVGAAGIAGGAVILATKPQSSGNATRIRATVSYGGPSVFLEGAF